MSILKLPTKVLKARKKLGWTQLKLAQEADVTPQTILKIESGEIPSLKTLIKVAKALNEAPAWFLQ